MATLDGNRVEPAQLQALALVNYGHFTAMRVEGAAVRGLSLHLDRLARDSRRLFDVELDPDRVRSFVRAAVVDVDTPVVVRVTVFDPDLAMGQPGDRARPRVLVTTRAAPSSLPAGLPGLRLRAAVFAREMPEVKHVGLLGSLYLRRAAQRAGADDVLFTSDDGHISEVATANIGFVDGERLVWPDAPRLPGVTMALINQVHGRDIANEPITRSRLATLDAAFVTNAAVGIRAVRTVDGVSWSPEEPAVLRLLRKQYAGIPFDSL
ncbi:MAG: aminotransferase class IV [Pseudonocardiales bacterium]|nr:aminotransferase class IV [Pseudonocardiales bacterium]